MTKNSDKSARKSSIGGTAVAVAAGAIGSAALAAALMFVSKRKTKPTDSPVHPEDAPETD